MNVALNILMWTAAALVAAPMAVVIFEVALALLPGGRRARGPRVPAAVLIPAHDERQVLGGTLAALQPMLAPGDRVLVVADNCTDDTAAIARDAGADVIERVDPQRRGKGYALAAGVALLAQDAQPPEVVVFLDADCRLSDQSLDELICAVTRTGRPVQGVYLMDAPAGCSSPSAVSAFAFLIKNAVRPRGLARLGLPVLLTGSGMAFPWSVIREANLATRNIVEDLNLGLDLALAGHAPLLCETALVTAALPMSAAAASTQRSRWEHGTLATLISRGPGLLGSALSRARPGLLALAIEISVPPLSLLVLSALGVWVSLAIAAALGASHLPLIVVTAAGAVLGVALATGWLRFGRDRVPVGALAAAPFYVLWKLPIYLRFITGPEKGWVRTQRDPDAS